MLGWVHLDLAVRVVSDLGLGFLLFLAGFEIEALISGSGWRSRCRCHSGSWPNTSRLATILGAFLAGIILGLADE